MYDKGFRLKGNIGNNSFGYSIRKKNNPNPQIYVTTLIQGTIFDIAIGDNIVFEEIDQIGKTQSFKGLKHFVQLSPGIHIPPIYIFDNHNHALFFRYKELLTGGIKKGIPLLHIDQHTDMNENIYIIPSDANDLKSISHFVNYNCNVGNFIKPAIQDGLFTDIIQINTEYSMLTLDLGFLTSGFILDIDLDFWHPKMGIEKYSKSIEITKNLISQARLVTIATSPYFMDQTLSISILKDILLT